MTVKPVPDGYHTVSPYLFLEDVPRLITFLQQVFDAQEIKRLQRSDGTIMHAEFRIGDSVVMIGRPPAEFQPMPASIHLYVEDTDAVYQRALRGGATSIMAPVDQFYGDREAGVKGPLGNLWWIATRQAELSPDELQQRSQTSM